MNKMYAISKLYNIVMDESWEGNDGNRYILTSEGLFREELATKEWKLDGEDLKSLVLGELIPNWKPASREIYYTVDFECPTVAAKWLLWENRDIDIELMENDLVFETEKEAIAAGEELVNWLNEIREDC